MNPAIRRVLVVLLGLIAAIMLLVLASYVNHRVRLAMEDDQFRPTGRLVEVDGHDLHVHVEGSGDMTLVFMAGGGTSSPTLDFRTLYSQLSGEYEVVVVEKAGYGFSEVTDSSRDIGTLLSETRRALAGADVAGPYVLLPHSMSGIEALYWAQVHPEEVAAIIGLDMAVPLAYEGFEISMPLVWLGAFAARTGLIRLLPGAAESDAIRFGTLTEEEKELYRIIFYRRTATKNMLNEVRSIAENAALVGAAPVPEVPMLLFSSNGEGTGWDRQAWVELQREFSGSHDSARLVELDGSHYIHNVEAGRVAEEVRGFLLGL